jgi:hypothetical protein
MYESSSVLGPYRRCPLGQLLSNVFLNPLSGPHSWKDTSIRSGRHRERVEYGHAPVIRVMVGF